MQEGAITVQEVSIVPQSPPKTAHVYSVLTIISENYGQTKIKNFIIINISMFIAQGPTQGETPTPQITGMITPGPRAR